jgi:hypothetical protein
MKEADAALLTTQQTPGLGVGGKVSSSGCDNFRSFEGNSSGYGRKSDGSGGGVDNRS